MVDWNKVNKMRRYISKISSLILTLSVIIAANSCDHKDLCFYHPHVAPVRVNVDWSLFTMEEPTGMTAYAYPLHEDNVDIYRFITHQIDYITLDLEAGSFHTLVFNQSESEYGTLEFRDLEDYNTAQVSVAQSKSSWMYSKSPETKVGSEPEWLAVGTAPNVEVTEEMVRLAEEEYLAGREDIITRAATKVYFDVATVTPISVIKQIEFNVFCKGFYNLRSVRASIEGMAEGCYLASGDNTSGIVAHTIDTWEATENPQDITQGTVTATLSTFGIPSGHEGSPEENKLTISFLLVDNNTIVDHVFNIGDILTQFNEMDGSDGEIQKVVVNLELPERLPDVRPVDGSDGGFDVNVDNWGDEITTIIPI